MIKMPRFKTTALVLAATLTTALLTTAPAAAQDPAMLQKLMAIKQGQDANKAKLAQYTWQETETIAIKGSTKDTKVYQVQMVNGTQQKTLLNDQKAAAPSGGRLKERAVQHETQEFEQYGQQIGALAKQYTTPNPEALMQAKSAGNISMQPGNGTISLIIKNYIKQGDSVTMTISEQTHAPVAVNVSSYLNDPKNAVKITAQFAQLPDGTNYAATTMIDGVSKQLTVNEQNSNYQHM